MALPFIACFSISLLMGSSITGSLFAGTAMTATSIAITANVLKEMGKLHTEVANAIIGTAVVDDIISLIALSVTVDFLRGAISIPEIFIAVVRPLIFIFLAAIAGIYVVDRFTISIDSLDVALKFPEFVFFLHCRLLSYMQCLPIFSEFRQ